MRFWLWDAQSMNLVGAYPDLGGALAAVRYAIQTEARESVLQWVLEQGEEADGGDGEIVARGEELIERAAAVGPPPARPTSTPT